MCEVIIVGSGIAGLMSAVMLARSGASVTILSHYEFIRSASCMAQGGINAAEPRENDSVLKHFEDTVSGGGWLADQQAVMKMCQFAPNIISMYDRIGVVFNRHPDGTPDTRFFGGSQYARTHYADTTTGAQLLSALDGQVRRYAEKGLIKMITGRDFVCLLIDDTGYCRGCVMQDIYTMKFEAYTGDALIMATGGYAGLYGRSTTAVLSDGATIGQLMQQGVAVANPEFVQFHPTAMVTGDKPRLVSESARGEGGRLWVNRDGKPWYFLEEMYPALGNLVTRDAASRAIYKVVNEMDLGIDGKRQVYLDITHLPEDIIHDKLSNVVELYYKYNGQDPRNVPMKVYPAPHYSMGGIYVDIGHRTEIKGLYACGECDYMYHGANRLGGNSLLSATYSGYTVADTIIEDFNGGIISINRKNRSSLWITQIISGWEEEIKGYLKRSGKENINDIGSELSEVLNGSAGVIRNNADLQRALEKIGDLKKRWFNIVPTDRSEWANSSVIVIRKLRSNIILSEAIIAAALARNESRGSHFKSEFPERDDLNWLKTTITRYTNNKVALQYKPVDVSIMEPAKQL